MNIRHLSIALTLAGLTVWSAGCVGGGEEREDCSTGVAVLWSSQTASPSWVELWTPEGRKARIRAEVQGIHKTAEFNGDIPSPWFAANGNTGHDKSSIGRLDRTDCSVHISTLDETGVFAAADVSGHPVVSYRAGLENNWVDIYSPEGKREGRYSTGNAALSALTVSGDKLLAFTTTRTLEAAPPQGPVEIHTITGPPDSMALTGRVNLSEPLGWPPIEGIVGDATTLNGKVYFALPALSNQDVEPRLREFRSALGVVDQTTGEVGEIPLEQDIPYQVEQHNNQLYVAHTFLNPAYRDFSEYRYISRVTPSTGQVETFDVGPYLYRIAFSDGLLYVLHYDRETPTLDAYQPDTMKKLTTHTLEMPSGGHYYIGAIGLGTPAGR